MEATGPTCGGLGPPALGLGCRSRLALGGCGERTVLEAQGGGSCNSDSPSKSGSNPSRRMSVPVEGINLNNNWPA